MPVDQRTPRKPGRWRRCECGTCEYCRVRDRHKNFMRRLAAAPKGNSPERSDAELDAAALIWLENR